MALGTLSGKSCDSWYEPETYWHKYWKLTFGKENSEIKIAKDEHWHMADVLTKDNVVIELQNSAIQKNIIRKREEFYGERMIWLINGIKFKDKFHITDSSQKDGRKQFRWEYPRKSWEDTKRHIFIDFHDDSLFWVYKGMGTKWGEGKYVAKEEFISKYGGDYKKHLSLFRSLNIILIKNKSRVQLVQGKTPFLLTSIRYNGKPRTLEIHFDKEVDLRKAQQLYKVIINGILNFEEKTKNLQLTSAQIISEGI